MRVSDEQRQRVVDELRRHCAAGRLDVDEYADRIEQALGASSLEDLDRALGDLPMMRIADPAGSTAANGNGQAWRRNGSAAEADIGKRGGWSARLAATAVVLITVMVVLGAVTLVIAAEWTWAVVLVAGWLLGLAQSRVAASRH
jgi:hypothetical protein